MYPSVCKALLLVLAATALAAGPLAHAGDDPNAPLGSNLNSTVDFSDEFPFVNLMKTARDWIPGNASGCFDCREPGAILPATRPMPARWRSHATLTAM